MDQVSVHPLPLPLFCGRVTAKLYVRGILKKFTRYILQITLDYDDYTKILTIWSVEGDH